MTPRTDSASRCDSGSVFETTMPTTTTPLKPSPMKPSVRPRTCPSFALNSATAAEDVVASEANAASPTHAANNRLTGRTGGFAAPARLRALTGIGAPLASLVELLTPFCRQTVNAVLNRVHFEIVGFPLAGHFVVPI